MLKNTAESARSAARWVATDGATFSAQAIRNGWVLARTSTKLYLQTWINDHFLDLPPKLQIALRSTKSFSRELAIVSRNAASSVELAVNGAAEVVSQSQVGRELAESNDLSGARSALKQRLGSRLDERLATTSAAVAAADTTLREALSIVDISAIMDDASRIATQSADLALEKAQLNSAVKQVLSDAEPQARALIVKLAPEVEEALRIVSDGTEQLTTKDLPALSEALQQAIEVKFPTPPTPT